LDACITRLRVTVKDSAQVNKARLKDLGSPGILDAGQGNFQIIFGVESDHIKEEIQAILTSGQSSKTDFTSIKAVSNGRVCMLEDVPDATFADRILGDGYAIEPSEGIVRAPVDATVLNVFRTNHALGLRTESGHEILIHVGIDTVKMDGRGFQALVTAGQSVKSGDALLKFDLALVKKEAKSTITPVVVTNLATNNNMRIVKTGQVHSGDKVLEL